MKKIVEVKFGSYLYGTNTENSDIDYKGVFIPNWEDILLQKAPKQIINNTKKDTSYRNDKNDVDSEYYSLHKFLQLLTEGNTPALDLYFANTHIIEPHPIWLELQQNSHKLITKQASSFLGYCYTQASKYSIKGSRLDSLQKVIKLLETKSDNDKLLEFWDEIEQIVKNDEHVNIEIIPGVNKEPIPHLEVCKKRMAWFNTVKQCLFVYNKVYNAYGERAKMAQDNKGVDFKALHHSLRVCQEAKELLQTGKITFPLNNVDFHLKIKRGELTYKELSVLIEDAMEEVKQLEKTSTLREKPDYEWVNNFICRIYRNEVLNYGN